MSTRSLTVFLNDIGQQSVVWYKHHDGFPIVYGKFLSEICAEEHTELDAEEFASKLFAKCVIEYGIKEFTVEDEYELFQEQAKLLLVDYVYVISKYEDYNRLPFVEVFANRYHRKDGSRTLNSVFCGLGTEFSKWTKTLDSNPKTEYTIEHNEE
jgi:hypothetical protein